jgi:hypothetical protein
VSKSLAECEQDLTVYEIDASIGSGEIAVQYGFTAFDLKRISSGFI